MRVKDFAPHLQGRMLPGLFSSMPFAKKPRFEGDPWATFPHCPQWFWMHADACSRVPDGAYRYALYFARGIHPAMQHPTPPKAVVADDRPSVGSMGARQPADAGPQRELFAEAA